MPCLALLTWRYRCAAVSVSAFVETLDTTALENVSLGYLAVVIQVRELLRHAAFSHTTLSITISHDLIASSLED